MNLNSERRKKTFSPQTVKIKGWKIDMYGNKEEGNEHTIESCYFSLFYVIKFGDRMKP